MANEKISQLTNGNPAQSGDLIPIDRTGANFSISAGSIAALASSSGVTSVSLGAPTGFTITGSPVTSSGTLAFVMPTGWATGALLLGTGAASVASLGIGSTGNVLTVSGGTAIWAAPATSGTVTTVGFTGGLISVANQTTTPALTVAGTSGGIVYFSSASTWASSAVLPAGDFVLGGGAGAAPTATFSIVPIANGGTGTGSTLVGLVRGSALAFTAAEISGDATTSGSNALTLATVNSNVGSFTYASITVNAKGLITAAASGAAPTGTVTTVGFTGGLISVATATTTPALTVAGTSGGIVYFSSASTWASSALLAAGGVVLGGGAGTAPATNTQLTFSGATLTVGLAGTSSGILALTGTTSGTATFTAPSVAVTITNPILISNSLQLPSGTVYSIGGDTGLSRSSAGVFLVGNGTAGDSSGAIIATTLKLPSGQLSVGVISAAMAGGSGAVGDLSVARSADTGAIFFGSSATIAAGAGSFWYWDGTYMNLGPGAQLSCAGGPGVTAGPFTSVTGIRTYGGIVIALSGTSDERLKDAELYEGGLGAILAISPVRYRWNAKGQAQTGLSGDQEFVGFIAQDVQRAIPEAITATEPSKDGTETYLSLDDRPIICALVNAIKELNARIVALEAKLGV